MATVVPLKSSAIPPELEGVDAAAFAFGLVFVVFSVLFFYFNHVGAAGRATAGQRSRRTPQPALQMPNDSFSPSSSSPSRDDHVTKTPGYYYAIGGILLLGVLVSQILLIAFDSGVSKVRSAAMGLVFLAPMLYLGVTIFWTERRFESQFSGHRAQFMLYFSWIFGIATVLCNLIVFFNVAPAECPLEELDA